MTEMQLIRLKCKIDKKVKFFLNGKIYKYKNIKYNKINVIYIKKK